MSNKNYIFKIPKNIEPYLALFRTVYFPTAPFSQYFSFAL